MKSLAHIIVRRFLASFTRVPVEWVKSDEARFRVPSGDPRGTTGYSVKFKSRSILHPTYGRVSGYDVSFYQTMFDGAPWQYKLTNDGKINPMKVFAGVGTAVQEFLLKAKPNLIWFVADEASRAQLYNRLLPKLTM